MNSFDNTHSPKYSVHISISLCCCIFSFCNCDRRTQHHSNTLACNNSWSSCQLLCLRYDWIRVPIFALEKHHMSCVYRSLQLSTQQNEASERLDAIMHTSQQAATSAQHVAAALQEYVEHANELREEQVFETTEDADLRASTRLDESDGTRAAAAKQRFLLKTVCIVFCNHHSVLAVFTMLSFCVSEITIAAASR